MTDAPTESHNFHSADMSEPMTSPGNKQPPKEWWWENACRTAAFRLRQQRSMSANTLPIREQVRDCVEFVCIVWEQIERQLVGGEPCTVPYRLTSLYKDGRRLESWGDVGDAGSIGVFQGPGETVGNGSLVFQALRRLGASTAL